MKGVAPVSFPAGGLLGPAQTPYERQLLEPVEVSTKQRGRFRPNTGDGEFCAVCRRSLNNLTYWFNGHGQTLCGQCAGRTPQ